MAVLADERFRARRVSLDLDDSCTLCAARRARREAPTMDRARPVPRERLEVLSRRIAFVPLKAVLWITAMPAPHQPIAAYLRENRRRADRGDLRVAVDDRLEQERPRAALETRQLVTVDAHEIRHDAEPLDRPLHRAQRRLQDIDLVDLGRGRVRDRERERLAADLAREAGPLVGAELLRILEAADAALAVEHDGRGDDRARERAAASLVDAGDRRLGRDERQPARAPRHARPSRGAPRRMSIRQRAASGSLIGLRPFVPTDSYSASRGVVSPPDCSSSITASAA